MALGCAAGRQSVRLSCRRRRGTGGLGDEIGRGAAGGGVAAGPGGRGRQEVLSSRPHEAGFDPGRRDPRLPAAGWREGGSSPEPRPGTRAAAAGASPAESGGAWSGLNPEAPLRALVLPALRKMRLSQKTVYQMSQAMNMPGNFWPTHQPKDFGCHSGKKSKSCSAHEDPMYDIIQENKRHKKDIRIQQSKQLLEDSASDDYGRSSSSSEQKRKKRKRRKNESISLPSQMRVRTQNDGAWLVQHSPLKNQTLWPKLRGPVEEGGVGEEQERRPEGGAVEAQVRVLPCLPGRM
ncbi:PREDICTED: uncharacterized protein LOC102179628 [Capra hircus]|uniref:uncharacterized protein LOC102179628 n=1 Tax=Capra hircus TaxID=9925 RepID=UPI000847412E|nr:PREDICTED: uncharacterized protein LOC102179628 [Capra hircus]